MVSIEPLHQLWKFDRATTGCKRLCCLCGNGSHCESQTPPPFQVFKNSVSHLLCLETQTEKLGVNTRRDEDRNSFDCLTVPLCFVWFGIDSLCMDFVLCAT